MLQPVKVKHLSKQTKEVANTNGMEATTSTTDAAVPASEESALGSAANGAAVATTTDSAAAAAAAALGSESWKRQYTDISGRRTAQFSANPKKRLKKIKEDEEIVRAAAFEAGAVEFLGDVTSALVRFEAMDGEAAG